MEQRYPVALHLIVPCAVCVVSGLSFVMLRTSFENKKRPARDHNILLGVVNSSHAIRFGCWPRQCET